jgi:hypothetical protein
MLVGNWIDDRPLQNPNGLDMQALNTKAAEIISKYRECVAPYTELNKGDSRD